MATVAVREERIPMPPGMAGVDLTIQTMAKMAMGQYGAGSAKIRYLAEEIILDARVKERDQAGEMIALRNWVMRNIRYVRDPLWYESVTYPESTAFETKTGDCDDHTVLLAALLGAVGIPTRFVTYGFKNIPTQTHVAMEAQIKGQWITLDPIVKDQMAGWEVPDPTTRVVYGTNTPLGTAGKVLSLGNVVAAVLTLVGIAAFWKYAVVPLSSGRRR